MEAPVVQMLVFRTCWIGDDIVDGGSVINVTMETAKRYINLGAGSLHVEAAQPAPVAVVAETVVEAAAPVATPAKQTSKKK